MRALLRRFGYTLVAIEGARPAVPTRRSVLERYGISVVVDVGANTGQFGRTVRAEGYRGRIVSFEPVADAFDELARRAARDPAWDCRRLALGDRDGVAEIHVAGNSVSSSLLTVLDRHVAAAPGSRTARTESVPIACLDSVAGEVLPVAGAAYLKLDVQGAELAVLRGAEANLARVAAIEAELSLVPLYEGQPLFAEVVRRLDAAGFALVSVEQGFTDPATGELLQLDGLFVRRV